MSAHSSRGSAWEAIRQQVLERDGFMCRICEQAQATTVDHIIPKVKGGTDDPANLLAACRPCNGKKGAKTISRTNYRNPRWYPRPTG